MTTLEKHYHDMCDIEFTVERGKLWMLQTRVGKRTPEAAFRIAVHMTDEGLIDVDEAIRRVTGAQLAQLMFPRFDEKAERTLIAKGMNASPGAAVGKAVFDSDTAVEWAERGEDVILVRKETNPDDLRGMVAARGILTSRGGKTSHAAVVARGMGRTCVCGAEALDVDVEKRRAKVRNGETIHEGDVISIDGTTGEVFAGAVPVADSVGGALLRGRPRVDDDLVSAVDRVMAHADAYAGSGCAPTPTPPRTPPGPAASAPRASGCAGPSTCSSASGASWWRTSSSPRTRRRRRPRSASCCPSSAHDFSGILEAMDGLPVTIRLIDPPLHEFLPDSPTSR